MSRPGETRTAALRRSTRGVRGRNSGETVHRARGQDATGGGAGEAEEVVSTS